MCVFAMTAASAQVNSVCLVGDAAGGWGADDPAYQLTKIDADNWKIEGAVLKADKCKLRANGSWLGTGFEWAGAFPTATGTKDGDIVIPVAGTYTVTLNTATNVYEFISATPIPVVKLVGTAVDGGTIDIPATSATTFEAKNVTLLEGLGQFSIDGTTIVGGTGFPTGIASDETQFIPIPAGKYKSISFDLTTGEYSFVVAPVYNIVSIVGDGAGGWPNDPQVDVNAMTTTDGINYTLEGIMLTAGEIKFRQNNNWTDPSFADVAFPSGTATAAGANIIVTTPGKYSVTFNLVTGAYNFFFATVAIVGSGAGGWPSDPQIDANVMSTTDGENYILDGIVLTDGEVKFRQNNSWTVNWGPAAGEFPGGIGTQGGGNIITVAGTYNVIFNSTIGDYDFGLPLSTKGFSSANFKVYPNPSQNNWNFTSANDSIESIQILDVTGKNILTVSPKNTAANVDATNLPQGLYFAKISTAKATETIKLMKN